MLGTSYLRPSFRHLLQVSGTSPISVPERNAELRGASGLVLFLSGTAAELRPIIAVVLRRPDPVPHAEISGPLLQDGS